MELILTVMANDRPGIAERIASVVEAHEGNWLESRLATMAGKFAGIVRVEVPEAKYPDVQQALQSLRDEGLTVLTELGGDSVDSASSHKISVVGNDRPGIVREVTQVLAKQSANVIDLVTEMEPASMSGGELFRATIHFALNADQDLESVIAALENLSPDLMVDH